MTTVLIPIKRKGQIHIMKIDYEDWQVLKDCTWFVDANGYAVRNDYNKITKEESMTYCHRAIMHPGKGFTVDHINGNRLDNRRVNLRNCTQQQNCFNKKSMGVCFESRRSSWRAYITVNGKQKHLGNHKTKEQAIEARKIAEHQLFKEFTFTEVPYRIL